MQSESQETSKTTPTPAQLAQQEATSLSFNWSIADTLSIDLLTALTIATRFYKLDEPRFTLFDEVHFGKFVFQLPTPPHPLILLETLETFSIVLIFAFLLLKTFQIYQPPSHQLLLHH